MKSSTAHDIKHRDKPNDVFLTPGGLVDECLKMMDFQEGDTVCDPSAGNGAFLNKFPDGVSKVHCEIDENLECHNGKDFLEADLGVVDWYATNPPYSMLDKWFDRSCNAKKGFAYLIGWNNLTARRIENCNKAGFGLSKLKMFKVFQWFGMSCFVVFEKGKDNIIEYERTVWR